MSEFNARVIEEFRANGGRVGGPFEGARMILVHHVGARTGTERVTPLVWHPDGDRLVIVASKAGAPTHPDWYRNLMAHPRVRVEVGTETFTVDVAEAQGSERERLWSEITAAMPGFADYERRTDRIIPVLVLTRAESSGA
ncbi:MAG: nitroreductase family deazaflavin-dependent oxidoreductase [Kineosporiaceae bacterium]